MSDDKHYYLISTSFYDWLNVFLFFFFLDKKFRCMTINADTFHRFRDRFTEIKITAEDVYPFFSIVWYGFSHHCCLLQPCPAFLFSKSFRFY